ncbi:aa3-type cytochrome c oxidase subunit IV [Neorhizobium sp. NPDC001467]|uniref:aa3-type cytochrome c oxidase subunit IV n=1 Tax=Neorhizobium sp. NPDC001467 TaxID=3390595 RepID=UPI003CFD527D
MEHHDNAPVETGAPMDYREHEKTYDFFLNGTKWSVMVIVVLLLAMATGFFTSAGLIGAAFVFIVLNAAGVFLLR